MLTGKKIMNRKNFIVAILLSVFGAMFVAAQVQQPSDSMKKLASKYLTEAEDAHERADFEGAYKKVNAAIQMYSNYGSVPEEIFIIAKPIYKDYMTRIKNQKDWSKVEQVNTMIQANPQLQSTQILTLQKEIANAIELDKENAKDEKAAQRTQAMIDKQGEMNRENNEKLLTSITDSINENNEKTLTTLTETITESNKEVASAVESGMSKGLGSVKFVIIILAAIVVLVLIIVLITHAASAKAQRQQQGQFEATLKLVAGMQQQSNQLLLGAAPDLYGQGMRSAGSSRWGVDALPAPELDEQEKEDLKNLAITCEEMGTKIDQATGRKNNSKNVSELVYKLAMNLGLNQNTAMAYFCAAMVYDAGYLSLDQELLSAETFTAEQKEQMKSHVEEKMFKPYYLNVPELYRNIFWDAASSHHENMDGSGYPQGLVGDDIPQIARLIHVVESYTSLISRRNYKQIMDRDSAINDLLSKPEIYDKAVVEALDAIL